MPQKISKITQTYGKPNKRSKYSLLALKSQNSYSSPLFVAQFQKSDSTQLVSSKYYYKRHNKLTYFNVSLYFD